MNQTNDPHKGQPVRGAGAPVAGAAVAMILLHGRGASAEDILSLAEHFAADDVAYLAPQAAGHSWYPFSFMAPAERNEPYLSSALGLVDAIVKTVEAEGVAAERIVLLGFSQGACLAAEYAARHARRYGGLVALTGGLIGAELRNENYRGDFAGTPALIACSDVDPHIPLTRVRETTSVLKALGAAVDERIYPGLGHTVNADEMARVRGMIGVAAGRT